MAAGDETNPAATGAPGLKPGLTVLHQPCPTGSQQSPLATSVFGARERGKTQTLTKQIS